MNAQTKVKAATVEAALEELKPQLAKLREKFPPNAISKLPKPTKAQTDAVKADFKKGVRCKECGAWHHPDVVHLDYVGHAALTDRLLDTDLEWTWEPVAFTAEGLPARDQNGGLWIKLTVCGVTRYGYGSADGKTGGDAVKEIIGDALRNAAMRFGAALDLWHKGDLHVDEDDGGNGAPKPKPDPLPQDGTFISDAQRDQIVELAEEAGVTLKAICDRVGIDALPQLHADMFESCVKKLRATIATKKAATAGDIIDDDIPY